MWVCVWFSLTECVRVCDYVCLWCVCVEWIRECTSYRVCVPNFRPNRSNRISPLAESSWFVMKWTYSVSRKQFLTRDKFINFTVLENLTIKFDKSRRMCHSDWERLKYRTLNKNVQKTSLVILSYHTTSPKPKSNYSTINSISTFLQATHFRAEPRVAIVMVQNEAKSCCK